MDKHLSRKIMRALRRILLFEWDPIGVSDAPEAHDEYDSYVGDVFVLIHSGATEAQVADHLHEIETDRMGLHYRSSDDLLKVSAKLIQAYCSIRDEDGV